MTWEDGSFNISRQREPVIDVMDSFYCNWSNKGLFSCQSDDETGNLADSPIGVMVAEMSSIYYVIGKGYVLLPALLFPISYFKQFHLFWF